MTCAYGDGKTLKVYIRHIIFEILSKISLFSLFLAFFGSLTTIMNAIYLHGWIDKSTQP